MLGSGYDTLVIVRTDGSVHRESVHGKNPGRDLKQIIVQQPDLYRDAVGFYYEFATYVSIRRPKNLVFVQSGVSYIDGRVFSRGQVSKFKNRALREDITEMMNDCGHDFAIETKGSWYAFDNTKDRLVSIL